MGGSQGVTLDLQLTDADFGRADDNQVDDDNHGSDNHQSYDNGPDINDNMPQQVTPHGAMTHTSVAGSSTLGHVNLTKVIANIEARLEARIQLYYQETLDVITHQMRKMELELDEQKLKQVDATLSYAAEKRKDLELNTELHAEMSKTKSALGTLAREHRQQKRRMDKLVEEKGKTDYLNAEMLRHTCAWLADLSVGGNPRDDMLAFIARMREQGGSLFRDGLHIPEDSQEVNIGGPDEDGDLTIIM